MNVFDQLVRSLVRGFGWGLGRRAADRMPLGPTIVVILIVWVLFGVFG